jgi:hypothetical protein
MLFTACMPITRTGPRWPKTTTLGHGRPIWPISTFTLISALRFPIENNRLPGLPQHALWHGTCPLAK